MSRILPAVLLGASLLAAQPASSRLALPEWLSSYPGVSPVVNTYSALVEASYTAAAKPEQVSAYYAHLFEAKGVAFHSGSDGVGTAIRASVPECDLLIKVRDSDVGASVKVDCSPPPAASPAGAPASGVVMSNGSVIPPGRNGPAHLKSAEEIRQYNEDRAREIKAGREAFDQKATAEMQAYDRPVYPKPRPPTAPIASYHDDAPPLLWPNWLVAVNGERMPQPTRSSRGPESTLSSKYQTNAAMTEVQRFYKDALEKNGFTVLKTQISTGNTSTGVKQNASGEVEAYRGEGPGVNPPTTTIKVGFGRTHLNEPISVWMSVSVTGSFGR